MSHARHQLSDLPSAADASGWNDVAQQLHYILLKAAPKAEAAAGKALKALSNYIAASINHLEQSASSESDFEPDSEFSEFDDDEHHYGKQLPRLSYDETSVTVTGALQRVETATIAMRHLVTTMKMLKPDDADDATYCSLRNLLDDIDRQAQTLSDCRPRDQLDAATQLQSAVQKVTTAYIGGLLGTVGPGSSAWSAAAAAAAVAAAERAGPSADPAEAARAAAAAAIAFSKSLQGNTLVDSKSPASAAAVPPNMPAAGSGYAGDRHDTQRSRLGGLQDQQQQQQQQQQQVTAGSFEGVQGSSVDASLAWSAAAAAAAGPLAETATAAAVATTAETAAAAARTAPGAAAVTPDSAFCFDSLQESTLVDFQIYGNAAHHRSQSNVWQQFVQPRSPFTVDNVDVAPEMRHRLLMGQPSTATANELLDQPGQASSNEVLKELLNRLEGTGIHVSLIEEYYRKRKYSTTEPDDHIGYYWSAAYQLPFFKQQAPANWRDFPQSHETNRFSELQKPDAACLRIHVSSVKGLDKVQAGDKTITEALKDLLADGKKMLKRSCFAHLRWQLPWQLTRQQYEELPQILGAELWELWQALTPAPPAEAPRIGPSITAQIRDTNLDGKGEPPSHAPSLEASAEAEAQAEQQEGVEP